MSKIVPIFFAIDNNYAPFLTIVLESILVNSSKDYMYEIYILNNDIDDEYKCEINKYNNINIKITFYSITKKINEMKLDLKTRDYYSSAIYYRLFIAELFPNLDKALYLDADIVVLDDISSLYKVDLGDNYLGAVRDDVINSCQEFKDYAFKALGISPKNYFNSGILVMNLKKFRDDKILNKFLDALCKIQFIVAPDQDYLNVICQDKVKYLDVNWNVAPLSNVLITEKVKLIHYKLTAKPWHYETINGGDKFMTYAKKTIFYDYILNKINTYSEEDKIKDISVEKNLKLLAMQETNRIQEFCKTNGKLKDLLVIS